MNLRYKNYGCTRSGNIAFGARVLSAFIAASLCVPAHSQTTPTNTPTDYYYAFTVTPANGTITYSVPGKKRVVMPFTIQNNGNLPADFVVEAATAPNQNIPANKLTVNGQTVSFNATNFGYVIDYNNNGLIDDIELQPALKFMDEVDRRGKNNILVYFDVPSDLANGSAGNVLLTVSARHGGTPGIIGPNITPTRIGFNDESKTDYYFYDFGNTPVNDPYWPIPIVGQTGKSHDGEVTSWSSVVIKSAEISITNTSTALSDKVNNSRNPKKIPESTVEYCVKVSNAAGALLAENVQVVSSVSSEAEFLAGEPIRVGGSVADGVCQKDGTQSGTYENGKILGTIENIPEGKTKTIMFQVKIK